MSNKTKHKSYLSEAFFPESLLLLKLPAWFRSKRYAANARRLFWLCSTEEETGTFVHKEFFLPVACKLGLDSLLLLFDGDPTPLSEFSDLEPFGVLVARSTTS